MDKNLIDLIHQQNPWIRQMEISVTNEDIYVPRNQLEFLASSEWDKLWTILIGPRQAGKTTLGLHLCGQLLDDGRYKQLLYLNCDYLEIRNWLSSSIFLNDVKKTLLLEKQFILFIDEVQRIENPGILLKIIADLKLPIKLIASGSSRLEIKSKFQEHLTGRQLESIVLPFSCMEVDFEQEYLNLIIYGSYPQVYISSNKLVFLQSLFENYIQKDIVELLKVGKPDVIRQLLGLLAHSSGQLLNFQQLATDCKVNVETIRHYLDILEQTFVIKTILPFVGNKRTELTSNPICYFIDCGFRNQSLNNFTALESRTDGGLLIESVVFQELYKYILQQRNNWYIHYWRTKGGAEVDFVVKTGFDSFIPIEVKYRQSMRLALSRSYKSFLDAYKPKLGIVISKNQVGELDYNGSKIYFVPFTQLPTVFDIMN